MWALPVVLVDAPSNLEAALVLLLVQRDRDGETLDGGAWLVAESLVRHQSEISQRRDSCVEIEFATDAGNKERTECIFLLFYLVLGRWCVPPCPLKTLFCVQSVTLTLTTVKVKLYSTCFIIYSTIFDFLEQTNKQCRRYAKKNIFDYMYEGSIDI